MWTIKTVKILKFRIFKDWKTEWIEFDMSLIALWYRLYTYPFCLFRFSPIWNSIRFDPVGTQECVCVCVCSVTCHIQTMTLNASIYIRTVCHVILRYFIYINLNWLNCVKKNYYFVFYLLLLVFFVNESILTCVE